MTSNGATAMEVQQQVAQNGNNKINKNKLKKLKKKKAKKERKAQNLAKEVEIKEEEKVEIEYVPANPLDGLNPEDPTYSEFANIFQRFAATGVEQDIDANALEEGTEDQQEEEAEELSKRKKKKLKRFGIAQLKSIVKRPDLVEAWDVTAADPLMLLHLKAYRNTVPVPRHWNQRRRYLQGKRGVEKLPFQLPDFIAATGISKIRAAIQQKEANKTLKAKQRDRMQPKLGKMDIDYEVLRDAFFKYQTKPKMTIHGDMYYEGKEFEITLREKKPGYLSEELKRALGMPDGAPPPYLFNMQRYGPPPAYPNLKVPGLNAPIPEGCRYGFHPGGWGKPPVDEFGRPLYGDVFGTAPPPAPPEVMQPIEKKHWGEFLEEEEEEMEEEEQPQEEQDEEATADGTATPSGFETPSGMETPETLDLRKGSKEQPPPPPPSGDEGKQLYTVLQQQERSVGAALMGSSHTYVIPSTEKKELKNKNVVGLIKSQATEKLDIALDPSEVENLEQLTEDALAKKYQAALSQKQNVVREDVSDIIAEHNQKKRKKEQNDAKKKKYKNVF